MITPSSKKEFLYRAVAVLFEHKLMLAGITVGGLLFTVFGTWLITPTWTATTKILVHQNPRQQMILFEELQTPGQPAKDVIPANNLIEISRSRELAERVVREFSLDEEKRTRREEPEELRDVIKVGAVKLLTWPLALRASLSDDDPKATDWVAKAVEDVQQNRTTVKLVKDTEIVEISAEGISPKQATDMANRLAELLVERTRDLDRGQAQSTYELTAESLRETERELRNSEEALERYRRRHRVIDPQREQQLSLERLDALERELAAERVERDRLRTQVAELEAQMELQEARIVSGTQMAANPITADLKKKLNDLEVEHARLTQDLTDHHPDVVSLEAQIDETRRRLAAEAELILDTEYTELSPFYRQIREDYLEAIPALAATSTRARSMEQEIEGLNAELEQLSQVTPGFAEASRRYQGDLELYNSLTSRLSELKVQAVSSMSEFDIKISDRAAVSDVESPDSPKWVLNLAAGLMVSLLLAVGMVLALDYWRVTFKTAREIEQVLGTPVLGTVPEARRGRAVA